MTFRASSLNRHADAMRRLLADVFAPQPDEQDPHVVQAEQEMQVRAMQGHEVDDLLAREWKYAKATWSVYATDDPVAARAVQHLDVIGWIGATLHERAQTDASPFHDEAHFQRYLSDAKSWQLGHAPNPKVAALLHDSARTVWASGMVPVLAWEPRVA